MPQANHSSSAKKEPNHGDFSDALATARKGYAEIPVESNPYVIQSGDSLGRIAQRLKRSINLSRSVTTLVNEMASLNNLSDPDRIYPGQMLRLPLVSPPKPTLNLPQTSPVSENFPASTQAVPFAQPQMERVTAPETVANQDKNFPLFDQRGNILRPSEIPTAYFTRQDFPTSGIAQPDANVIEISAGSMVMVSGQLKTSPAADIANAHKRSLETQVAMYKEDQLLAHPGGDDYFLNRDHNIHDPSFDQSRLVNRVGKDLADTGENLLNIAKNLAMGAEFKYMAENGEIQSGQRVGLLGTLKNFVEDVFSGLSFGAYVPDGEKAPECAGASVGYFFKKIFYDAPIKDLLIGIPHAAVNIVKDTALASLNLLEVIPDATIGNFEWGQKATTTIFDNSQVAVDYLTDILPGGDAWLRVHAAGPQGDIEPPVYFNLMTNEQGITDSRWAIVRNTPFRKTIETIGSLLSDAAVVALFSHTYSPSSDQRHN